MGFENPVLTKSYNAGADLSAAQYKAVKFSSGSAILCSAITDRPIGVLQNDPAINQTAVVMEEGITKWVAAGVIAQGAAVAVTAAGKCQTAVSTQPVAGVAREAAAADGDIIAVLLTPAGGVVA
jgi:hypothetical protein